MCNGFEMWTVRCGKGCIMLVGDDYNQTVGHLKLLLKNGFEKPVR